MKSKILEVTKEAFNKLYGNAYLKGKYGDDWVDIVVTDLEKGGTIIKFVEEKQIQAKKELEGLNKIRL